MASRSADVEAGRRALRWGVLSLFLLMATSVVLPLVVFPIAIFDAGPFRTTAKDPASEFTKYTSLPWPDSAAVVGCGDSHGGWHGDGEYYLVFDADKESLARWLSQKAPWGDAEWKDGPVPDEIAGHCFLFEGSPNPYRDSLAGSRIRYCAQDFKLCDIPWHNGRLLAVDPTIGRVYLSWWDF